MSVRKREHVHGMWAYVADAWEEHADLAEMRAAALTEAMLAPIGLGPDDDVLELACGPGGLGVGIAPRVRSVVMTDVVPRMVEIAAKRAADRGLVNVETREADLEEISEPDAAYDVVLCREGLMFALDPSAALREIRRVLRPGGRLSASVWSSRADNPWLGIPFDVMEEHLGHPVPPDGMPGPFSLGDGEALAQHVRDAGFGDVELARVEVPLMAPNVDAWWERLTRVMPVKKILDRYNDEKLTPIRSDVIARAAAFANEDGVLLFPGVSWVVTAATPAAT